MDSKSESSVIVPLYQYPLTERTWEPLHKAVDPVPNMVRRCWPFALSNSFPSIPTTDAETIYRISTYPSLTFVVIINPNSGPGVDTDGWRPDESYAKEIPRFTSQSNVILVGYVRLDYCRRQLAEIEDDITKYGNWTNRGPSSNASIPSSKVNGEDSKKPRDYGRSELGVQGIFFDETPNLFNEDTAAFLDTAGRIVKATDGILGDRLIIHNPGTVPDSEYATYWQQKQIEAQLPLVPPLPSKQTSRSISVAGPLLESSHSRKAMPHMCDTDLTRTVPGSRHCGAPDITTVFETSHSLWLKTEVQIRLSNLLRQERQHCCFMVHSVPLKLVVDVTMELRERGKYVFVTDLRENYYETFGRSWEVFIETMATWYIPIGPSLGRRESANLKGSRAVSEV